MTDKSVGAKHDEGKLRLDLIPPEVIEALGKVLSHGCKKYGDRNWENGIKYSRVYGAVQRHLLAWLKGDVIDDGVGGSGLPHLHHALCELAFLVAYEDRGMGEEWDDVHQVLDEPAKPQTLEGYVVQVIDGVPLVRLYGLFCTREDVNSMCDISSNDCDTCHIETFCDKTRSFKTYFDAILRGDRDNG